MTDLELNEAVARKLGTFKTGLTPDFKTGVMKEFVDIPAYSTSVEAAWEIVEKLRSDGWRVIITVEGLNHACTIGTWLHEELADTTPRVICEAFLKLS